MLPDRVTIKGQAANGVFYGLQTLRKSVPAIAYGSDIILPAAVIKDAPRFAYRGMMLDVGRHFFSVDFVKRYIDYAQYELFSLASDGRSGMEN